jgi:hypothetical protein
VSPSASTNAFQRCYGDYLAQARSAVREHGLTQTALRLPHLSRISSRKKRFRRSLKTRNWQKALAEARQKELDGFKQKIQSPTIEQACDKFIQDGEARGLREPTLYKFRLLFKQLKQFAADKGLVFVSNLTVDEVRQFRASWPNKNFAARKKFENLRAFLRFCNVSGWIATNPAMALKPAKTTDRQIVPITKAEFTVIPEGLR